MDFISNLLRRESTTPAAVAVSADPTAPEPIAVAYPVAEETEATAAATPPTEGASMRLEAIPEVSELVAGSSHDTMIGIHIAAPPSVEEEGARAPVDCVVVSDVSGSMQGEKISLLRETTKMLLKELSKQDRVGLVTFDSNVGEPLKLSSNVHMDAAGRSTAEDKVDQFKAGSATNLSGGLFAGVEQFPGTAAAATSTGSLFKKSSSKKKKVMDSETPKAVVSRVQTLLLLTDGIANHGVRDRTQLVRILSGMLQERPGLAVHTFGYGSNHQSDLLRAISEAGSGSYYFVETNDDIRGAFGDCLGGVLSVVAQNLVLHVEVEGDHRIRKVHHPAAECLVEGRHYTIRFNDLYGDEERDVLVSVHLPTADADAPAAAAETIPECSDGEGAAAMEVEAAAEKQTTPSASGQPVLRCTLKYVDVLGGRTGQVESTAQVRRPAEVTEPATPDPRIALHRTRIQVAEALDDARESAERGDLARARTMLAEMQRNVDVFDACSAAHGGAAAQDMLMGFRADLQECCDDLVDHSTYKARGRHKMSTYAAGHAMQRCMESATVSSGGQEQQRFNAYRTGMKKSKVSAFISKSTY